MVPALSSLLEEFETLSLDERVYLVLRSDEDLEVCFHFQRKDAPKCWSVWYKLSEEASRQQCSRATFPHVLRAFQVPESTFVKDLSGRLLTQAAFADEFVRSVTLLLGADAVRESIRGTQAFMEELRAMVRRTLGAEEGNEPSKDTVKGARHRGPVSLGSLGHDAGESNPPSGGKSHLRVIRTKGPDE